MDKKKQLKPNRHDNKTDYQKTIKSFIAETIKLDIHSEDELEKICTAFTTPGFGNENGIEDYDRLEFYGDAVIKYIVCKDLFEQYPTMTHGNMTFIAEHLYSNKTYPECLFKNNINLIPIIRVGNSFWNLPSNQKNDTLFSIVGDCFEALIGALDNTGNYDCAEQLVKKIIDGEMKTVVDYMTVNKIQKLEPNTLNERGNKLKNNFISRL